MPFLPVESDLMIQGSVASERFLECVHCGLCLPSCPTYLELGTEMDSPRGRIQFMRSFHEGKLDLDANSVRHLDLCLGCRACETICPSGVHYGELIEEARYLVHSHYRRSLAQAVKRRAINRFLSSPVFLRFLARLSNAAGQLGLGRYGARGPASVWGGLLGFLPDASSAFVPARLPEKVAAVGERRFRVGLLTGCVMQSWFGGTQKNAVSLLAENGCEVVIPKNQNCCGALQIHNGDRKGGQNRAGATISAFKDLDLDAIVTTAAGCGAAMRGYGSIFENKPLEDAALTVGGKVRDIADFLDSMPELQPRRPVKARVTYHDACHLLNGQGVHAQPRRLLEKIPGLELIELRETEICCGSAGSYNLTEPGLAMRLGRRKARNIAVTGADMVVTGNPGCILQIRAALKAENLRIPVHHTADLLVRAYT